MCIRELVMRWPWWKRKEAEGRRNKQNERRGKAARKIGLALSGGSVRGAAHLGVLEVLEGEGIRPDFVAGTSAGSVVGALYCAGLPVDEIKRLGRDVHWTQVGRITRPRLGFFDISRLESTMNELLEGRTFDQLSIPFAAVAVDILRGEVVVLREGSVARAVRASCALPGAFTPLEEGGQVLVDGGLLNNLPVSVVQDMGADYAIAVDLGGTRGKQRRPGNLLEMWGLTYYTLISLTHNEASLADCLIQPDVAPFNLVDFSQAEALIEAGRKAAAAAVPKLQQDLGLGGVS
jgi:NTE family protein